MGLDATSISEISVMIIDDSSAARSIIEKMMQESRIFKVKHSCANGDDALKILHGSKDNLDVILLDFNMPDKNGLQILEEMMALDKKLRVILVSSLLTRTDPALGLKALQLGASEYIAKPSGEFGNEDAERFRKELIRKAQVLGVSRQRERKDFEGQLSQSAVYKIKEEMPVEKDVVKQKNYKPDLIVVASSTGGPQALKIFFKALKPIVNVPIVVVQHMPEGFDRAFADQIESVSKRKTYVVSDGISIQKGEVYIAPYDSHVLFTQSWDVSVGQLNLNKAAPINFCRPAADILFKSAAEVLGSQVLALVFTGMGADGFDGAQQIVKQRGKVITQDERSSKVWGMPGVIAKAGLSEAVLSPSEMANYVNNMFENAQKNRV